MVKLLKRPALRRRRHIFTEPVNTVMVSYHVKGGAL